MLCCAGAPALAQIAFDAQPADYCFMAGEPVEFELRLRNNTGGILRFGGDDATAVLSVRIESDPGRLIPPLRDTAFLSGAVIMPLETKTMRLNLGPAYYLRAGGIYRVVFTVSWGGRKFTAAPVFIDVRGGAVLQSIKTGLPLQKGATRLYTLKYLQKDKGEALYLLIEDDDNKISYGVFNLGRMVRFYQPELKVDESGNAHVLFQTPDGVYIHTAFTATGIRLFSRPYAASRGIIRLAGTAAGEVVVESESERTPGFFDEFEPAPLEPKPLISD